LETDTEYSFPIWIKSSFTHNLANSGAVLQVEVLFDDNYNTVYFAVTSSLLEPTLSV